MTLASNVLRLRTAHGYSQRQLANLAKVSAVHVSTVERGITDNVGLTTLKQLARVFKISVSELIGEMVITPNSQINNVTDFVYKESDIPNFTPDELYLIQLANQMVLAKILQDRKDFY